MRRVKIGYSVRLVCLAHAVNDQSSRLQLRIYPITKSKYPL